MTTDFDADGSSAGKSETPGRGRKISSRLLAAGMVGCLFFCGCGTSGVIRPMHGPFGLGSGRDSLSEAVQNDPFPDAAEVNLQG